MDPTQHRQGGEVHVASGAQIGVGAFLYAQAGSHIHIHTGACVGEHCILHVFGGSLVIESGATLGAGVLVFGQGVIGARAFIGERATLIQPEIPQEGIVPPGSLVGDRSRPVADPLLYPMPTVPTPLSIEDPLSQPAPESVFSRPAESEPPTEEKAPFPLSPTDQVRQQTASNGRPIPGQATLQQLLRKIYPHRQVHT